MSKNSKILLLVGLLVIVGIVWGPQIMSAVRSPANLTRYPAGPRFYCESCGWHFDADPSHIPPIKCEKCGKMTAMQTGFTPMSPSEFIQCKQCQTRIPGILYKWSPEDQSRWGKRFKEVSEGKCFTGAEIAEIAEAKWLKTPFTDWMKWNEFQHFPQANRKALHCPRCGNANPSLFDHNPEPSGAVER